jgi:peptidoglycan/xylan/chitin deacetylase (PgdA/CDA1 family)
MPGPLANAAIALGATSLACGAWAYAAMWPESQIFGPILIAGKDPNEAALTFDDGPNGDTTLRLLDILARHNAPATFFLIGGYVRQQPQIVRAIAAAGHVVGNHTMTHPWLHMQTTARIHQELSACNKALEDTLGTPIRFFRPPHGSRRPEVLRFARQLGLTTVNWNIIPEDWKPHSAKVLVGSIEHGIAKNRARRRASNILLHDGGNLSVNQPRAATLAATDRLLAIFAQQAIRPVTVAKWESDLA